MNIDLKSNGCMSKTLLSDASSGNTETQEVPQGPMQSGPFPAPSVSSRRWDSLPPLQASAALSLLCSSRHTVDARPLLMVFHLPVTPLPNTPSSDYFFPRKSSLYLPKLIRSLCHRPTYRALFFPFRSPHCRYEFLEGLRPTMYLGNSYFQTSYYVLGIIRAAGEVVIGKISKISHRPCSWCYYSCERDRQ